MVTSRNTIVINKSVITKTIPHIKFNIVELFVNDVLDTIGILSADNILSTHDIS